MKRIVVHCSPEFIPGQTYVAISRVRHADDVRVVGFRKKSRIRFVLEWMKWNQKGKARSGILEDGR